MEEYKIIKPEQIKFMNDQDSIIVNRTLLNYKLVECELRNSDCSYIEILTKAIKNMNEKEKECKRTLIGAELAVEELKKLFSDYKELPANSFFKY